MAEEQQAVEECTKADRQRIRWADLKESQTEGVRMESPEKTQEGGSGTGSEKLVRNDMAVEEGLEVGIGGESQEEQQEAVVERQQKEEEMMAAGVAEMHKDRSQDCVEKGEGEQFRWEEWDWESMADEDGSAREAFEPRGSRERRRQEDGQDEGGNEVLRRQDDGQDEGGNKGFRRQDDCHDEDDKKQVERQGKVVRRQFEGDMRQDGDDRGWATDVWKSDEGEKRGEMGKGGDKGGERVNLEDCFRRFKQRQREQQQQGAETRVGRKMAVVNTGKRSR